MSVPGTENQRTKNFAATKLKLSLHQPAMKVADAEAEADSARIWGKAKDEPRNTLE